MTYSRGLCAVDRQRLDALVRTSNVAHYPGVAGFVEGDPHRLNEMLRSGAPPNASLQRFLDELPLVRDYVGASYRVSQIGRSALDALDALASAGARGYVVDRGVQSAFILPAHAAAWARRAAAPPRRGDAYPLFSIFDESVPQKNLSGRRFVDHVAVPPGTPLRLKAWRTVAVRGGTAEDIRVAGRAIAHVIAHFALADTRDGAPYDLPRGTPGAQAAGRLHPDLP